MKPFEIDDPQQTALAAIELKIRDEIDAYNDAVASGNDELAQMIHLNIQGLKRRREFWLKPSAQYFHSRASKFNLCPLST
jgi:hypothetical protein